jgi:agmatinase
MQGSSSHQTFLGVEACDVFAGVLNADVIIFGASDATPHDPGQASHAAAAPDAIRSALASYAADLARWDFDQGSPMLDTASLRVLDHGNLPTNPAKPEENRAMIAAAAKAVLAAGAVPVVLGGDDSVPIPFFQAFEGYGPLTIVQIDAHLDWRDERNGLRHTFSSPMRRASEMPWVERIIQVGLRGVGASRRRDLDDARAWGAHIVTAEIIRRHGIRQVLDLVPQGARCLVTVDCDGLDPGVIPAVIVPQPGGLGYGDVIDMLDGISDKARLVGFDIVELVPALDLRGLGTLAAARIVCNAVGRIAAGRRTRRVPAVTAI